MSVTISQSIEDLKERYASLFDANSRAICQTASEAINGLRSRAYSVFMEKGIPDKKVENYRYSDFKPYFGARLEIDFSNINSHIKPQDLYQTGVPESNVCLFS